MNYYLTVFKKYATFSGRAQRAEYWYFYLFHFIVTMLLFFIDMGIIYVYPSYGYAWLYGVYTIGSLIPLLAVSVRRLHDVNKSGWMLLVNFIPFIGGIWYLVLSVMDGTAGDNQYGPDPKGRSPQPQMPQ